MPRIVVGDMPWDHEPSPSERAEKRGPAAMSVGRLYGSRSPSVEERRM